MKQTRDVTISGRRRDWFLALLPVATCLTFVLISNHVWEDYLITFRASRNLVQGHGLVYTVDERVHTFTSVVNTLLPALYDWMLTGGKGSIYPALWAYRITCIAAFSAASFMVVRLFRGESNGDRHAAWLVVLLMALEIKAVSFSTNGQEVAFMLLCVAAYFSLCYRGIARHWKAIGLWAAALMYTRPDGFVYASLIGLAALFFAREPRSKAFVSLCKAALVAIILYLPWMLWAWWYYGSPVPHTITAKAGAYRPNPLDWSQTSHVIRTTINASINVSSRMFEGLYAGTPGWPEWTHMAGLVCGLVALGLCVTRSADRLMRTASLAFVLLCLYVGFVGTQGGFVFPWYLPAAALLGLIALSRTPGLIAEWLATTSARTAVGLMWSIRGVLVAVLLAGYVMGTIQLTLQQRYVEDQVRRPIGEWLARHAEPDDIVSLEPIGYIGFYSNLKLYDWPGLTSPEVVASRRRHHNQRNEVIKELRPDWLVLRPNEMDALGADTALRSMYEVVGGFDNSRKLEQHRWIPGWGYLATDIHFLILKLKPDAAPAPPPGTPDDSPADAPGTLQPASPLDPPDEESP